MNKFKEEEQIKNFLWLIFPNIIEYFNYENWIELGKNSEKNNLSFNKRKYCVIDIREINEYIEYGIISHCFCIPFSPLKIK